MFSLFDIFKIGIGPSSSHTVGPMRAAQRFIESLRGVENATRIRVTLYGSLAWTAQGHATDTAIIFGLLGEKPDTIDIERARIALATVMSTNVISIEDHDIAFDLSRDLVLDFTTIPPRHPNTLQFELLDSNSVVLVCMRFCSIGGGSIIFENDSDGEKSEEVNLPYYFSTAQELINTSKIHNLNIAEIVFRNELTRHSHSDVINYLNSLISVMDSCIERGIRSSGFLPGKLQLPRRAPDLYRQLVDRKYSPNQSSHGLLDWISMYAIAVNEENASGGRVVTAPTNGAAGIIPAVLRYYRDFCVHKSAESTRVGMQTFLLTASAIGSLYKANASISGAEVGCQGEVGVAASMAAAGLTAALDGTPCQIENAAEIAMEHHLGMTCDPIAGLVQIPCIERNAFGAVKAINAASLAMLGDGSHFVSLDRVINTMAATGRDMNHRYKETSLGGLAVNFPDC